MWMTDYIREIQKWFKSNVVSFPVVPDGSYDIVIDGKLDHVKIVGGKINCCNFDRAPKEKGDAA